MVIDIYVDGNYKAMTYDEAVKEIQDSDNFVDWCTEELPEIFTSKELFEFLTPDAREHVRQVVTKGILKNEYYKSTIEI